MSLSKIIFSLLIASVILLGFGNLISDLGTNYSIETEGDTLANLSKIEEINVKMSNIGKIITDPSQFSEASFLEKVGLLATGAVNSVTGLFDVLALSTSLTTGLFSFALLPGWVPTVSLVIFITLFVIAILKLLMDRGVI